MKNALLHVVKANLNTQSPLMIDQNKLNFREIGNELPNNLVKVSV